MSVTVTVTEMLGQDGGDEKNATATFTRRFLCKLSDPSNVAADLCINHESIPGLGDNWPNNVTGRSTPTVRSRRASPLNESASRLHWVVSVEYSNAREDPNIEDQSVDPTTLPLRYTSDSIDYQVALEQDEDSQPQLVRNTVGDAFDPVPTVVRSNRRITVQRNTSTFSESDAAQLQNTVNNANITLRGVTYSAGRLRLIRWSAQSGVWNDDSGTPITYYEQTIEIEVAPEGKTHDLEVLNQGYRRLVDGNPVRITDGEGNPAPEPVLLSAEGNVTTTPHFLTFKPYKAVSWAGLGSL